ncbi:cysteinyl leukotriene receptor 1-like [Babylonia areolata]|uniref:cysteinyl leukotriene receptor 1-like n=1 Tax=Babylonia areolata TaxID=304850 RepID=UPI003FD0D94D
MTTSTGGLTTKAVEYTPFTPQQSVYPLFPDDLIAEAVKYNEVGVSLWRITPLFLVVGTLGNVMSVVVMSRKNMRRSNAAIYLIVMAVVDLVVLYTGLLRHWIFHEFGYDIRHTSDGFCRVHALLVYASLQTSVWILVAFTFERVVSVYWPHQVKHLCTTKTSAVTLVAIAVVFLVINSHFLFTVGDVDKVGKTGRSELKKCTILNKFFLYKVWPWIDLCLYSLVPFCIIIVCNISIVVKLIIGSQRVQSMFHLTISPTVNLSSMTAILMVLNTTFLITTMPVSITNIMEPYIITADSSEEEKERFHMIWAIVNLLQYTHHTINFLLYCLSGSRFREELKAMFSARRQARVVPTTDATNTDVQLRRFRSQRMSQRSDATPAVVVACANDHSLPPIAQSQEISPPYTVSLTPEKPVNQAVSSQGDSAHHQDQDPHKDLKTPSNKNDRDNM